MNSARHAPYQRTVKSTQHCRNCSLSSLHSQPFSRRVAIGHAQRALTVLLLASEVLFGQSVPDWFSRHSIRPSVDLLLRFDNVYDLVEGSDIHRSRVWLRPGFQWSGSSWLQVGGRGSLALSSDGNRDNISRFDNFHSDDLSLDQIYLAVKRSGLEIRAGKFAMPFQVSEMLWDADIQPSGLYAAYGRNSWTLRVGLFHRSHIHHDRSTTTASQLNLRHSLNGSWAAQADLGFFTFNALDQFQLGMERQNRVQIVDGRLRYQSAFRLMNGRYRVEYRGLSQWPLAIEASYVHNLGGLDERQAIEFHFQAGKLDHPGDWRFSYWFQSVGREAVVGAFTSDEWWYHSDYRGSRLTAALTVLPHTYLQLGTILQRRNHTVNLVKRVQIDFGVQF